MRNVGVLTSGGDAPGMNAAIRAVTRAAIHEGMKVYGIRRGYEGLLEGDMVELDARSVGDIMQYGGTMLKSARSERFKTEEGILQAMNVLDTFDIHDLVCIGGDGTLTGANELSKRGIRVMGLPGTIDNDLAYTDFTIGFDTAVQTVLDAITKIRDTTSAHERVTVIEVMGRRCGDIALYSALAGGAMAAIVPEVEPDLKALYKQLILSSNAGKPHAIIIRAEGADISSDDLVQEIKEHTGQDVRLVVLSYLQRGGSPVVGDRILATLCGFKAIELIKEDSPSKAIGIVNTLMVGLDLDEAIKQKRVFDRKMYDMIGVLAK